MVRPVICLRVLLVLPTFLALPAIQGCHFVRPGGGRTRLYSQEYTVAALDKLIASAREAERQGVALREWSASNDYFGADWRETLAQLYALRSTCTVGHTPIVAVTAIPLLMGVELWRGGASEKIGGTLWIVCSPVFLPVDVVQLPVQLCVKTAWHLSVSDEEIETALEDLAAARALGFDAEHHPTGEIFFRTLPLDRIGYEEPHSRSGDRRHGTAGHPPAARDS